MKRFFVILVVMATALCSVACNSVEEDNEKILVDEVLEESPYNVFEGSEVTVIDEEYVTVTIGNYKKEQNHVQYCVTVNNLSDQTLNVSPRCVAINGETVNDYFYIVADSGCEVSEEITIYDLDNPEDLTRLSLLLKVADENFNADEYLIDIYPEGLKSHQKKEPQKTGGDVLIDQKEVFLAIQGHTYDHLGEYALEYLAFNDSNKTLSFKIEPISINGVDIEQFDKHYILPNTFRKGFIDIYDFKEMDIDEVTEVTLNVCVETIDGDKVVDKKMTVYFEE